MLDNSKFPSIKKSKREKSYNIEIDAISRRHLKFFMENELSYYNNLIISGTMRLRAFPEEVVALREGYGRLWAAIAYTGKTLRDFVKKDLKEWPKSISSLVPSSAIKNGRVEIDERKLLLFDSISIIGNIHPQMRRHMAAELLSTMLPQADQLVQSQKNISGQMKDPVHMLVPRYYPERRHIQLTKDLVTISYNKEKQQSELCIPYTDKPLIIKDANITEEKFNLMIIRQQPNISVNNNTPWQVDLMITNHNYLMDLTDQNIYVKKRRAA